MVKILEDFGITESQLRRILSGRKRKPKIIPIQMTDREMEIGLVADTHLCSMEEKLDELHTFYEICRKTGIKKVLHCGDMVAGWGIYRGQENEVKVFGVKNQASYAIKNYPQVKGITIYFITGNHDLSFWKTSGIDIGEIIASQRNDLVYLGQYHGEVSINGVILRMLHSDGGGAYALSYKAQKIAEQIPSGQKPHILCFGHWHTSHYFFYRNMHILNAGCFEGQTTFLLRKGINPTIGGWTIKLRLTEEKDPSVVAITPSFIPFFGG